MILHRSAVSRWAAFGVLGVAGGLGAGLFGLNVFDQGRRLALFLHQGLGFADPACTTGYCDYGMFWLAGFLVRHGGGGVLYAPVRYAAAAAAVLPYKTGYWPFVYPPTILFLAAALSLVPLVAGYYGFCVAATGLSFRLLRQAGISRWCVVVGLIGPAPLWNLYLGQLGLLCGALLVAGLAGVNTRPGRAGGLLGLLCIKPQYALLVPVAVCAGRHWRAMLAGCVAVLALLALSLCCGGAGAWIGYLGPGRAAMSALLVRNFGGFQVMGTSVFWMLRSFGVSLGAAYAGQVLVSALAALGCWVMWRGQPRSRCGGW